MLHKRAKCVSGSWTQSFLLLNVCQELSALNVVPNNPVLFYSNLLGTKSAKVESHYLPIIYTNSFEV